MSLVKFDNEELSAIPPTGRNYYRRGLRDAQRICRDLATLPETRRETRFSVAMECADAIRKILLMEKVP